MWKSWFEGKILLNKIKESKTKFKNDLIAK